MFERNSDNIISLNLIDHLRLSEKPSVNYKCKNICLRPCLLMACRNTEIQWPSNIQLITSPILYRLRALKMPNLTLYHKIKSHNMLIQMFKPNITHRHQVATHSTNMQLHNIRLISNLRNNFNHNRFGQIPLFYKNSFEKILPIYGIYRYEMTMKKLENLPSVPTHEVHPVQPDPEPVQEAQLISFD